MHLPSAPSPPHPPPPAPPQQCGTGQAVEADPAQVVGLLSMLVPAEQWFAPLPASHGDIRPSADTVATRARALIRYRSMPSRARRAEPTSLRACVGVRTQRSCTVVLLGLSRSSCPLGRAQADHHLSHASLAYRESPFNSALIFSFDGTHAQHAHTHTLTAKTCRHTHTHTHTQHARTHPRTAKTHAHTHTRARAYLCFTECSVPHRTLYPSCIHSVGLTTCRA